MRNVSMAIGQRSYSSLMSVVVSVGGLVLTIWHGKLAFNICTFLLCES